MEQSKELLQKLVDPRLELALEEGKLEEVIEARLGTPFTAADAVLLLHPMLLLRNDEETKQEEDEYETIMVMLDRLTGFCSPQNSLADDEYRKMEELDRKRRAEMKLASEAE